jgi:signal-transduction protein with cAMP-binding, CBS, and nucleotidyltransferase domain
MQTDGIWFNIFRLGHAKEGMSEILGKVPIFQDLNERELQTLETIVHPRTYGAGETIFVESEPGVGMYVINSGGVDILLNDDSEEPLYLAQLEPDDFFGEMALLIAVPVAANVKIIGQEVYETYRLQFGIRRKKVTNSDYEGVTSSIRSRPTMPYSYTSHQYR